MDQASYCLVVGLGATGLSCVRHLSAIGEPVVVADSRLKPPALETFRREFPNVDLHLGGFDPALFEAAREIVVSPGVSVSEGAIERASDRGVAIVGDIELFVRSAKAPIIKRINLMRCFILDLRNGHYLGWT